jgi:hypothetical protein
MEHERDDYGLRVLIEQMQQQGSPEREIEAAVRSASRRLERQSRQPSQRPKRLGRLGRRLLTTR